MSAGSDHLNAAWPFLGHHLQTLSLCTYVCIYAVFYSNSSLTRTSSSDLFTAGGQMMKVPASFVSECCSVQRCRGEQFACFQGLSTDFMSTSEGTRAGW